MSRIIKSDYSRHEQQNKLIRIRSFEFHRESDIEHIPPFSTIQTEEILQEARIKAEEILASAKDRADQILEDVQIQKHSWENEELPLLKDEAAKEGYSHGYQAGKEEGYSEMADSIKFARGVIESSRRDYKEHIDSSEKTILSLSVKVAEKIIGKKLTESEDYFLSLVKRAIKEAREYKEVQLHIHPSHYGSILAEKDMLTALFPNDTDLYIYPDEELEETSCIIESSNGRIDASVDSQLQEIKEKLLALIEGE